MGQLNTCCPGGVDFDKIKREKKIDTSGKVAGYDSKLTLQKDGVYAKVGDVETWTSKSGVKIVFEGVNMKIGKKSLRIYFDDINSYLDFSSYSKKIKVGDSYIYTNKWGSFYIYYDWDHKIYKYYWGNTHIYSIEDGQRYHLAIYNPHSDYRYVLYQGSNITGIGKNGGKLKWGKNSLKVDRKNNYDLIHNHKNDKYNILGNSEKKDDTHFKSAIFFPHNFNIKSDDTRFDLKTTQKGMKIHFWFNLKDSNDAGMEIKGNKVEIKVDHTGYIVKIASYDSYEKKGDFKKKEDQDKKEESKDEEEQKEESEDGDEKEDSSQAGSEKQDQDELQAIKDKIVIVDSDSEDETESRKKKGESKDLEISMQNQQKPEESKEQQEFHPPIQQETKNQDYIALQPQEPLNTQEQQVVQTETEVQQQVVEAEQEVQQPPQQNTVNENHKDDTFQQAQQEPNVEANQDQHEQKIEDNENEQPQQQFQAPPEQHEDQQQPNEDVQDQKNEEAQDVQQNDEQQHVQQIPNQDVQVDKKEDVQEVQQQNEEQQHVQQEDNDNAGGQD